MKPQHFQSSILLPQERYCPFTSPSTDFTVHLTHPRGPDEERRKYFLIIGVHILYFIFGHQPPPNKAPERIKRNGTIWEFWPVPWSNLQSERIPTDGRCPYETVVFVVRYGKKGCASYGFCFRLPPTINFYIKHTPSRRRGKFTSQMVLRHR